MFFSKIRSGAINAEHQPKPPANVVNANPENMKDNVVDISGVSKDGIIDKEALIADMKGAKANGAKDIYFKGEKGTYKISLAESKDNYDKLISNLESEKDVKFPSVFNFTARNYTAKHENYNAIPSFNPGVIGESVMHQPKILEIARQTAAKYNIPEKYLISAFAIETHPDSHDVASRTFNKETYKYINGAPHGFDSEKKKWVPIPKAEALQNDFPVSGFQIGGIDNAKWLNGLGFQEGKDYAVMASNNEKGDTKTPFFKDGETAVKAFMSTFGREVEKYQKMDLKDPEAAYTLARLSYNAGAGSQGFKKALEYYQAGGVGNLPHVQAGTNVESNLEVALKVLNYIENYKDPLAKPAKH